MPDLRSGKQASTYIRRRTQAWLASKRTGNK
jgi:hypothetical protein